MAVSKTISKNTEMGRFNRSLLIESFLGDLGNVTNLLDLILKVHADFSFTPKIYCLYMDTGHAFGCYKHH